MYRNYLAIVIVMTIAPMLMGSSCQLNSAMQQVRNVHGGIVQGFVILDTHTAEAFTEAGDECISRAHETQLVGEEAREYARACMEDNNMYALETALRTSREILAELENVYDDIENGEDRINDWKEIARRLLLHARQIMIILEQVNIEIPDDLMNSITMICDITHCEE